MPFWAIFGWVKIIDHMIGEKKIFSPLLACPPMSGKKLFNTSDFAILQVRQSYVINKISNPRTF